MNLAQTIPRVKIERGFHIQLYPLIFLICPRSTITLFQLTMIIQDGTHNIQHVKHAREIDRVSGILKL